MHNDGFWYSCSLPEIWNIIIILGIELLRVGNVNTGLDVARCAMRAILEWSQRNSPVHSIDHRIPLLSSKQPGDLFSCWQLRTEILSKENGCRVFYCLDCCLFWCHDKHTSCIVDKKALPSDWSQKKTFQNAGRSSIMQLRTKFMYMYTTYHHVKHRLSRIQWPAYTAIKYKWLYLIVSLLCLTLWGKQYLNRS